MRKDDESAMNQSPCPAPICSDRLSAMPSPDVFRAVVRSMSYATAGAPDNDESCGEPQV
jgi:hypothetical protein